MHAKLKLLSGLTAVAMLAGALVVLPQDASAVVAPTFECTHTACSPQPTCEFDRNWNCFLQEWGCNGNERCLQT